MPHSLYIHPSADLSAAREFWLGILTLPDSALRIYFKRHNAAPKRNNTGRDYHGTIRMDVRRSTDLNYRILGWIESFVESCGVV